MAKISHREKILLGYSSNTQSNSSSRRNSEVDFSDVFGGPPRCSSTHEYNHSENDDIDEVGNDADSADGLRSSSWFGLTEKPVFGEQTGVRRRHTSEDFFDDIFGGDQPLLSSSLSPRVHLPGRNPFSSAPSSRAMSPSRPSSPATETSASPFKLSLPSRMANTDITTSTSFQQSYKSSGRSLSRFNKYIQNQSALCDDHHSSYNNISVDGIESTSDSKLEGTKFDEANFVINSKGSELLNDNIKFHFSIYKWPSKGVPFLVSSKKRSPSRTNERMKSEKYLSTSEGTGSVCLVMENCKTEIIMDEDDSPSSRCRVPSTLQISECDSHTIVRARSAECKFDDKLDPDMFKSIHNTSIENATNKVHEALSDGLGNIRDFPFLSHKNVDVVGDANSFKDSPKKTKSNMKLLSSLFKEDIKGNNIVDAEKGEKQNIMNETKIPIMNDVSSSYKVNKNEVHQSSTRAIDDLQKSKSSGKVKDFVKVLNKESSSKVKSNAVGQSHSWRWKEATNIGAESEVKSFSTRKHDETQASYVNLETTSLESIQVVSGESFLSGEQQYTINSNGSVSSTTSYTANNEPNVDGLRNSASKSNATSIDDNLDKKMIQEIDVQATEANEETLSYERKVLQWSKGKEGNIRALLSTMQYVLWPNSGWKPIPLVDIIEANAVKKSYQRALLCLHPDKLQQKGAAPYQKFIAEKVFDILQEAWEQFNSLGLL
ncbi:hypothetical protein BVRB_4g093810 isoform B [Beta vulgaris subsp. vulgaris]|uniref:J domain-containing protein required for chloroplast accumulation response 1 isoform X1 n=1 Tax=Beta vulgaris subsp. vulgaris TaxID=3555 RepID=UPI00053FBE4E|nr:J domain-containing protein required for chloroplast accumulation response 1 isoform X1 [Beta vulgaris subsp. vulgaris]KMS98314.1 hypothetical protein BVRB_4g093810 isoform B [Beta vulgaris subsp. vulgaris]